jgi:B-cell receptor-associated protein 31
MYSLSLSSLTVDLFTVRLADVNACYKHHSDDAVWSDGLRIRLLTAQRDMYISGFCLFLFLLLRLVYHSMETNLRLEKSLAAMKKQAEGASNGYKNLLEENESTTAQLKKLKELVGDNEDDVKKGGSASPLDKLLEENASLTKQLAVATKELKSAETKVDAVKKQAEGQSAAFMKLMDDKTKSDKQGEETKALEAKLQQQAEQIAALTTERDSLKSQVQDYDFMFADAKKKAD